MAKRITTEQFAQLGATANGHPDAMGDAGVMMYRRWKDHAAEQGTRFTGKVAQPPRMELTEHYPEQMRAFIADTDPDLKRSAQRHFAKKD